MNKKILLGLILIILLVGGIFLSGKLGLIVGEGHISLDGCVPAVPSYGVVRCVVGETDERSSPYWSKTETDASVVRLPPCLGKCHLNTREDIYIPSTNCGILTQFILNVAVVNNRGQTNTFIEDRVIDVYNPVPSININMIKGDVLEVKAWCASPISRWSTPKGFSVQYYQRKMYLEEENANLPPVKIQGTDGCTMNAKLEQELRDKGYYSKDVFDPLTGEPISKKPAKYTTLPSNWAEGDSLIYVYDWVQTSALKWVKDANNNPVWCGGTLNNRQIYNVEKVSSVFEGSCFWVPTKKIKKVECCYPSDCSWKGQGFTCNPQTWQCEKTAPCDSDLDCQQSFTGTCINHVEEKWYCDKSERWGDYSGKCKIIRRNVEDCPSDCTENEYYNSEQGKCLPRVQLDECPPGMCCFEGGTYKPRDCPILSGLKCCPTDENPFLGVCKEKCVDDENGKECSTNSDCFDGNENTIDICENGVCVHIEKDEDDTPNDILFIILVLGLFIGLIITIIVILVKRK